MDNDKKKVTKNEWKVFTFLLNRLFHQRNVLFNDALNTFYFY